AIIGMLVALLLPAVQAAREAARRMQCSNHLKQIGLAVHNFENTRSAIPPFGIVRERVSFFYFILPFIEQQALYNRFDEAAEGSMRSFLVITGDDLTESRFNGNDGGLNHRFPGSNQAERVEFLNQMASISIFHCPTRRPAGRLTNSREHDGDWCAHNTSTNNDHTRMGPATDYAMVSVYFDPDGGATTTMDQQRSGRFYGFVWDRGTSAAGSAVQNRGQRGPFRWATTSGLWEAPWNSDFQANPGSWTPTDTFAYWSSGASNQLLLGEKYYAPHEQFTHTNDGTWFVITYPSMIGLFRGFHDLFPMARSGVWENVANCGHARFRFGSWHPGVVNFVLGDGSVRGISQTTPTRTMFALGHVQSTESVSLP
ncbi:MAG: DUF1559 domain-containing protein, partial [Planctomycetaceae bacterium]|nr:DUF1559 domain-containing protein [Planctomycetaceae bacterium]